MHGPIELPERVEYYPIEDDPTFVGPGEAALLGVMRQFEVAVEESVGYEAHSTWTDPREAPMERRDYKSYDVAVQAAKVQCGLVSPRTACLPKWCALAFTDEDPSTAVDDFSVLDDANVSAFPCPVSPMVASGTVDLDAARHLADSGARTSFTCIGWDQLGSETPSYSSVHSCTGSAASRPHTCMHRHRHALSLKVTFEVDSGQRWLNSWHRLLPSWPSRFWGKDTPTCTSTLSQHVRFAPGTCTATDRHRPPLCPQEAQSACCPLSQKVRVRPSTSTSPSQATQLDVAAGSDQGLCRPGHPPQLQNVRAQPGAFKPKPQPGDTIRVIIKTGAASPSAAGAPDAVALGRSYFATPPAECETDAKSAPESLMRPRQMPSVASPLPLLRLHLSSQIPIYPAELDRPEVRGRMLTDFAWITGHRAAGAVAEGEGQFDRFAVFDTAYHMRIRHLPRGWTLEHLVSELLSLYPRLNGVTFLQDKLSGLPSVQVSVTTRDFSANQAVLPVDFRGFEGRICTIRVTPGLHPDEVRDICRAQCPQDRLPRRPFSVVRSDGQPLEIPPLPDRPPDHGVGVARDLLEGEVDPLMRLGVQHYADEDLHDITSTTTTTIDPDLRMRPVHRPLHLSGVELLPSGVLTAPGAHVPVSQLGLYRHIRRETGGQMHFHMFARGCAPVRLIGTVSWTMLDLCSLVADNLDDRARRMQVITAPIPGLLQPQVTVTDCGVDEAYCVLPVDMRCLPGAEVVAIPFCSGMRLPDIIQAIIHEIPDCRTSLQSLLDVGEIYVQDCNGFLIDQLQGALPAYQWLAIRRGRPPFAGALSLCTSTTTTPPAVLDNVLGESIAAVPTSGLPLSPPPVSVDPPALLTKSTVAADLKAGGVHSASPQLLPTYLGDARFQHGPVCAFSWGTDDEQQDAEMFTVFDVVRHWTVQRRDRHATLPHLIQTAVRSAPFGVRSVHILTVPVPGLPRPQMSLGRDRDPVAMWPLPWDLRPVGGDVRTAGHFPGEAVAEFAGKVQQIQPDLPRLRDDIVSGQVAVTDALGFVGGALPLDLEQVQYFQVESHHAARLHVDTLAAMYAGPSTLGGIPTSTTTTNPVARPIGVIYRVVLLWGDCIAQEQVWPPCRQLDGILGRLVRDVFACAPRHPPSHEVLVSLAKEQPPLTDGIQEILFFILGPDYDACPVVVVDERSGGHGLQSTRLSRRARCDSLVNPAWRREGVSLVVNGAPENLAQRCADTGDLLQFADRRGRPRSRPLASLFDAFPSLVPYAWPLDIGPRSDQLDVPGTARERRTAQGMWRHKEGACLVLGPTHGPVCFRLGVPVVPSRTEAAQGLALLDWRCPAHLTSLHDTALIAPNRATFAHGTPGGSILHCAHRTHGLASSPNNPTDTSYGDRGRPIAYSTTVVMQTSCARLERRRCDLCHRGC